VYSTLDASDVDDEEDEECVFFFLIVLSLCWFAVLLPGRSVRTSSLLRPLSSLEAVILLDEILDDEFYISLKHSTTAIGRDRV
jgi:hypothetical protein